MFPISNGMKKIFYIFALIIVLLPSLAFAYTAPSIWPTGFWGPLVSCVGNYSGATGSIVPNPSGLPACASLCDLIYTIENVIYFGISIALFILSPILFAWGGIMYMVSRGKPEGTSKARKILIGALIGVLITLCAWLIVNTIVSFLSIANVGGFGNAACQVQPNPTQ